MVSILPSNFIFLSNPFPALIAFFNTLSKSDVSPFLEANLRIFPLAVASERPTFSDKNLSLLN